MARSLPGVHAAGPTATTDLDDGYRPETSLADAEDEIEEDAGARAVAEDPEFSGDDAHPPT